LRAKIPQFCDENPLGSWCDEPIYLKHYGLELDSELVDILTVLELDSELIDDELVIILAELLMDDSLVELELVTTLAELVVSLCDELLSAWNTQLAVLFPPSPAPSVTYVFAPLNPLSLTLT